MGICCFPTCVPCNEGDHIRWWVLLCLGNYLPLEYFLICVFMVALPLGDRPAQQKDVPWSMNLCFSCGFCPNSSPHCHSFGSDFCCLVSQRKPLGYFQWVMFKNCHLRKYNFLSIQGPIRQWMVFLMKSSAWNNNRCRWNVLLILKWAPNSQSHSI